MARPSGLAPAASAAGSLRRCRGLRDPAASTRAFSFRHGGAASPEETGIWVRSQLFLPAASRRRLKPSSTALVSLTALSSDSGLWWPSCQPRMLASSPRRASGCKRMGRASGDDVDVSDRADLRAIALARVQWRQQSYCSEALRVREWMHEASSLHARPTCSQHTDSQQEVSVSMLEELRRLESAKGQGFGSDSGPR